MAIEVGGSGSLVDLTSNEPANEASRLRSAIVSRRALFGASWMFLASALLPWQRVCFDPMPQTPTLCLVAHVWQGPAALLGWVAILSTVGLIAVLLNRQNHPGDLGTLEGGLSAALVVSGGLRAAAGMHAGGAPAMTFGAIAVGVVFFAALNVAVHGIALPGGEGPAGLGSPGGYRTPMWVVPLVVAMTIGLTSIPYQASDLGRWGGPLRGDMRGGGGVGEGIPGPVGRSILFEFPIQLENQGMLPLHVDRVRLAWLQPGAHVQSIYARRTYDQRRESCDRVGATRYAVLAAQSGCLFPSAGVTVGPAGDTNLWVVNFALSASRPGVYRFSGVFVDYHVGWVRFSSYQSLSGYLCANADWRMACQHVPF